MAGAMVGRPINQDKMLAELEGRSTYTGSPHSCGNDVRYVKGGGCVHCAREISRAQREALAEKRAAAAESLDTAAPIKYPEPFD
jgi:hypothetical protein